MNNLRTAAVFATAVSFLAFVVSGALFNLAGANEIISYLAAYFCSIFVVRFVGRLVPEEYREEAAMLDGDEPKCDAKRHGFFGYLTLSCATTLVCLLAANVLVGIVFGANGAATLTPEKVLVSVIIKPFCEETLFRGAYLSLLFRRGISELTSTFVTALMFSAIHRGASVPLAFFAGILLALLVLRVSKRAESEHRSEKIALASAFAVHGIYNLILCIASAML